MGRRMMRRAKKMGSEIADLKQTISFSRNQLFANTIYGLYNFSLTNCDRAVQVGKAYQFYRIKKITLKVKPNVDTFTTIAGPNVPYLYYMIDKGGNFVNANVNFNSLRDAGSKAVRFDDKIKTISWAPTVLQSVYDAGIPPTPPSPFAAYKTSPWLNTNQNALSTGGVWAPNSIDHFGCVLGIEQDNGPNVPFDVDITIHYQFKKPRYESVAGGVTLVMPDLNLPAYAGGSPGLTTGMLDV